MATVLGQDWNNTTRTTASNLWVVVVVRVRRGPRHHARDEESVTGSKVLNALGHVTRNIESIPFLMQVGNIIDSLTHLGSGNTTERVVDNLLASMVVLPP